MFCREMHTLVEEMKEKWKKRRMREIERERKKK